MVVFDSLWAFPSAATVMATTLIFASLPTASVYRGLKRSRIFLWAAEKDMVGTIEIRNWGRRRGEKIGSDPGE